MNEKFLILGNAKTKIMKRKLYLILCFFIVAAAYAQNHEKKRIDSLLVELPQTKDDTAKVKLLNQLSEQYCWSGDYDRALQYADSALALAKKANFKKGITTAFNNIGIIDFYLGKYPEAMGISLAALRIAEEIDDKNQIAVSYKIMGLVDWKQKNGAEAIENYLMSIKIMKSIGNTDGMARAYNNIAIVYAEQGEYEKAIENYSTAFDLMKSIGDITSQYIIYNNIGEMHSRMGDYAMALEKYMASFHVFDSIGNARGIALAYLNVGSVYIRLNQIPEGKKWLKKSLAFNKKMNLKENIRGTYESLARADSISGDFSSSLKNYKMYIVYRDSLINEENTRKLIQAQIQFDFDKKEAVSKAEREKQVAIAAQKLREQKNIRNGFIVGFAVVLLFAGVFFIQRNKIKKQKERAEHSESAKQQFLANMSHEIRTPMNAIIGMTDLALETPFNKKQENYLTGVKKASENLLHIINDILDFSKVEAGKMELAQLDFSIRSIAGQVIDTLRHKAEEKGIEIFSVVSPGVPDVLIGDPVRLNQILMNLAGNALKFTEKGSVQIGISKISGNENNARIKFSVIDTGIGIPADKLDSVFESFSQAHASDTRKFGGTGLGLSISKQFIELMGGGLKVESEVGSGTTFYFELELPIGSKERMEENETSKQIDGNILNGLKILLVDDNADNRIVARDTIEAKAKVTVAEAVNGQDALGKLKEQNFDIVLMDVQMPVMDGLEATRKIRNEFTEPKKNIPVVALTASVIRSDLDKCREAGMNDYVPKPFKIEELIKTIAKLTDRELKFIQTKKAEPTPTVSKSQNTDLTYLSGFCEGNQEKMKKYINIFLESVPGFIQKLEAALASNDFGEVATQVHSFKTKFVMMGMKQAKELSQKLESDCRMTQPDRNNIIENTKKLAGMVLEASNELRNENIVKITV